MGVKPPSPQRFERSRMPKRCPQCQSVLLVNIKLSQYSGLDIWFEQTDDVEQIVREAILGYWRWVVEGRLSFGCVRDRQCEPVQYFYDPYHSQVEYKNDGRYHFSIQTSDSPEGDQWMAGSCLVKQMQKLDIEDLQWKTEAY